MKSFSLMTLVCVLVLTNIILSPANPSSPTLKGTYGKLFDIGVAIRGGELPESESNLVISQFNSITPENIMKPALIHPDEDRYDFKKTDEFVAFATNNGLHVHGHTLVWRKQTPGWFFKDGDKVASRELALKRMCDHIKTVVGRYKGRVKGWDVVNEALGEKDDYLDDCDWLRTVGPDYVVRAYMAAREADPEAKLYYNDFGIESPGKRAKAIRLIRELKAHNINLDGIGIQGHWSLGKINFSHIDKAITDFNAEGVPVMFTELDIDVVSFGLAADSDKGLGREIDPYASGCPQEVLALQAEAYRQLFALFLKRADMISMVTFWGLDDGHSWLNSFPSKRTNHPLLWDRSLKAKPALQAVLEAATGAP